MGTLFRFSFVIHDALCDFIVRHTARIKTVLLLAAHLSLFGLFFQDTLKSFGEAALILLLGILFLSPLSRITRMRLLLLLMGFRRQLGIWFAYLATVHGLGYTIALDSPIFHPDQWMWFLSRPGIWDPKLAIGTLAYTLTLPLFFTSNSLMNRLLGRYWKKLHRLVYAVLVLVLLHKAIEIGQTPDNFELEEGGQVVLVLGAYVLLKLLAWKNFLPPLAAVLSHVADRYKTYRASLVPPAPPASVPPTPLI